MGEWGEGGREEKNALLSFRKTPNDEYLIPKENADREH
jgi:hypothetical protein